MNKQSLVEKVHEVLGGTKVQAEEVVSTIFDTIVDSVASGTDVAIAGFGSFVPQDRAARTARNPRTGEPIQVAATTVPKFKVAKAFKDSVKAGK
jgi:DNA-binding protein HU-beta